MRVLLIALMAALALMLVGCPGQIVEYPEQAELSKDGIKKALTGDDFRKKTAAREQIEKLSAADRVDLLKELLAEGDAPTRMIAISELMKLPEDTWRPLLTAVAESDPDPEVKELAGMAVEVEEDEEDEGEEEAPVPADSEAAPEATEAPADS
jgi:hypothetical protein